VRGTCCIFGSAQRLSHSKGLGGVLRVPYKYFKSEFHALRITIWHKWQRKRYMCWGNTKLSAKLRATGSNRIINVTQTTHVSFHGTRSFLEKFRINKLFKKFFALTEAECTLPYSQNSSVQLTEHSRLTSLPVSVKSLLILPLLLYEHIHMHIEETDIHDNPGKDGKTIYNSWISESDSKYQTILKSYT
jgi:Fe-S cluster biosynthesis and repair protein YggX